MNTLRRFEFWVLAGVLLGAGLASGAGIPAAAKPTVVASPNAPVMSDAPRTLFENAEFQVVLVKDRHLVVPNGQRFGHPEYSQAPGLYVLGKKANRWIRIDQILLKDAVLGYVDPTSALGRTVQQPWDLRPLASQEYVSVKYVEEKDMDTIRAQPHGQDQLELQGMLFTGMTSVELDATSQSLHLTIDPNTAGPPWDTVLTIALKDLSEALASLDRWPKGPTPVEQAEAALQAHFAAFLAAAGAPSPTIHAPAMEPVNAFVSQFAAKTGIKLVPIPAGRFIMGSPADEAHRARNEGPQTMVTLTKNFFLGATPVTQAQWAAVMGARPWTVAGGTLAAGNLPWDQAMEFCQKLTAAERAAGRLPAGWQFTLPTETIDAFTSVSSNMPSGVTPMRVGELAANALCNLLGEPETVRPWERARAPSGGPYPEWVEWDRKEAELAKRLDARAKP
jgi:hypothetical protein